MYKYLSRLEAKVIVTKSLLEELDKFIPAKNKHNIIESRAAHVIASAINLVHLIKQVYPDDQADDLVKRLYRSIISEDDMKFKRKIKELKGKSDE